MMTIKRLAAVAPEMNLREHVSYIGSKSTEYHILGQNTPIITKIVRDVGIWV